MCMYILPLLLLGTSSCQLCSSFSLSLAQTTANYELMIPENLKATTTRRWIDLAILSLILRLLLPFPSLAILPYWFSRTDPFMRAVSMNNGLFYFYLALFCDFRSSVDQRIQLNQGVQSKQSNKCNKSCWLQACNISPKLICDIYLTLYTSKVNPMLQQLYELYYKHYMHLSGCTPCFTVLYSKNKVKL